MLKKDELLTSGSCLNKADPNEPIFVLRAKDPAAAQTVRLWAAMAEGRHEQSKTDEARYIAEQMETWRDTHCSPEAPLTASGVAGHPKPALR